MTETVFDFEAEEQQADELKFILGSQAWRGFFIPKLQGIQDNAIALLLDPSAKRKSETPDDYLRAVVSVCESVKRLGSELDEMGQGAPEGIDYQKE
jgi:hypothetical protein